MHNITLLTFLVCTLAMAPVKAGHLKSVSLKVTVNATQQFDPLTGTATDISPDSLGQYLDGQQGVCANFDTSGDLIINFDCVTSATPRRLGLNLGTFLVLPTGGTNACSPPSIISSNNPPVAYTNYLATAGATNMPTAAFQNMTIYDGTPATIYYVQMFLNTQFSDASQTLYRLNYHQTLSSAFPDAALGSYTQVRRMSATEWVAEPNAPSGIAGNPPNAAMLVWVTSTGHSSATSECGFYQVPFSFTLDQQ